MMKKRNKLNVACACDDNYSQHTGVMLCSLFETCSKPENIDIYILDGGISEENKNNLKKVVEKQGGNVFFKKPSFEKIKNMNLKYHGATAYTRIFLCEILKKLKKVIWVDSDIIFEADILELNNLKLKKSMAAVSEGKTLHKKHKEKLGMDREQEYFNSGFLFMDLENFRERKYPEKITNFLINKKETVRYSDQDGFNYVLQKDWQKLSPKWNVFLIMYRPNFPENFLGFSKTEVRKIIKNPKAIHFTTHKPWYFSTYHPIKKEYWKYLKKTPWKDYKYPDKNIGGLVKKLKNMAIFYFPPELLKLIKKFRGDL